MGGFFAALATIVVCLVAVAVFYFKFVFTLNGTWPALPSDVARDRRYRRMLRTSGPLNDEAYVLMTRRVLTAVLPLLPRGCRRFRVNLPGGC